MEEEQLIPADKEVIGMDPGDIVNVEGLMRLNVYQLLGLFGLVVLAIVLNGAVQNSLDVLTEFWYPNASTATHAGICWFYFAVFVILFIIMEKITKWITNKKKNKNRNKNNNNNKQIIETTMTSNRKT